MSIFAVEESLVSPLVRYTKVILLGLGAIAVTSLVAPILLRPWMSAPAKSAFLGVSAIASIGGAVVANSASSKSAVELKDIADRVHKDLLLSNMERRVKLTKLEQQLLESHEMLELIELLPEHEQHYFLRQLDLAGLLPAIGQTVEVKATLEQHSDTRSPQAYQISGQQPIADVTLDDEIDLSWLSSDFIDASKAVFGSKGSGKSTYLAFEAYDFMLRHPEGELRIGDLHWDGDLDGGDPSKWLWGIDRDTVEQHFVYKQPAAILRIFRRAYSLLEEREAKSIKSAPPFKLICDEFARFLSYLDEDQRDEVIKIVEQVQFGGRKYGIDITLGLHSLKQKMIKVDSSALLGNMDLLCLGTSLADSTTRWPIDIDRKQLLAEQQQVNDQLDPNSGRAVVVRRQGDRATVEVLPLIDYRSLVLEWNEGAVESDGNLADDLPKPETKVSKAKHDPKIQSRDLNQSNPARDLFEQLKGWYRSLGRIPSDEELLAKYEELWGQPWGSESASTVSYLRGKLEE